MTGRPSLDDLVAGGAHDLAAAALATSTARFASTRAAQHAVVAYRLTAGGLLTMTRRLFWPRPQPGDALHCRDGRPHSLLALRVEQALQTLAGAARPATSPSDEPAAARLWRSAAASLRAAAALLDSAGAGGGRHRSVLDVAGLAATLGQAAGPLTERAMAAGHDRATLLRLASDGDGLAHAAGRLGSDAPSDRAWRQLELVHARIRLGDPLTELADRCARLHRYAWALTRDNPPAIGTLARYALVGQYLHQAAAVVLAQHDHSGAGHVTELSQRAAGRRTGWQTVHRQLQQLRSVSPASPGVRDDATRVAPLLAELSSAPTQPADLLPTLLRCCQAFDEVAVWHEAAVDRLAGTGQLTLAGRPDSRRRAASAHALPGSFDAVRHGYQLARGALRPDQGAAVPPRRQRTPPGLATATGARVS